VTRAAPPILTRPFLLVSLAFGVGPIAMGAVAAASTTPVAFLSAAAVALIGAAILWRWLEDAKPV
jgi:membrane protein implicated in regulation of membrane protease activity